MSSRGQKIGDVLFFFSSLWRQPTNQDPVRHSDPGTPLQIRHPNLIWFTLQSSAAFEYAPRITGYEAFKVRQHNRQRRRVLDLQSLPFSRPHPDLFPRLISSVFRRYLLCPFISIHHFHLSCLVSALLSTGYGPRCNAIDNFSR